MAKAREAQDLRGPGAEPEFAALEDLFDDVQHKSAIRKKVNDFLMMYMNAMASQITGDSNVCSTAYIINSCEGSISHQYSPITVKHKSFLFHDVIMKLVCVYSETCIKQPFNNLVSQDRWSSQWGA